VLKLSGLFEKYEYNERLWKRKFANRFEEMEIEDGLFHWININNMEETEAVDKTLGLLKTRHRVVKRNIVTKGQRPKIAVYPEFVFIVVKMPTYDGAKNRIRNEQVSFILTKDSLISFQQRKGDVFSKVRKAIETDDSFIRKNGPDYLLQALLESIINNYFDLIEKMDIKIEILEERLIRTGTEDVLEEIHKLRKNILILRNSVWPLKDVFNVLSRDEISIVKPETRIYFRDSYEHVFHIIDSLSIYREMVLGMSDTYLSNISNRMNRTMTTLTIFATIFIPLTFLTGIYGMNFKYMPEISWIGGYPLFWVITVTTVFIMLKYFKDKKIL
jgi:magnesium transporter